MDLALMMHRLETEMSIPLDLRDVFNFFSNASNLEVITPPEMRFEILTEMPIVMASGVIINYRLRILGCPFKWQSRITSWSPPHEFVDEQVSGPYQEWVHTHRFKKIPEGTVISDSVKYRSPLWPLGEIAFPIVKRQLGRVFEYRQQSIKRVLLGVE